MTLITEYFGELTNKPFYVGSVLFIKTSRTTAIDIEKEETVEFSELTEVNTILYI